MYMQLMKMVGQYMFMVLMQIVTEKWVKIVVR